MPFESQKSVEANPFTALRRVAAAFLVGLIVLADPSIAVLAEELVPVVSDFLQSEVLTSEIEKLTEVNPELSENFADQRKEKIQAAGAESTKWTERIVLGKLENGAALDEVVGQRKDAEKVVADLKAAGAISTLADTQTGTETEIDPTLQKSSGDFLKTSTTPYKGEFSVDSAEPLIIAENSAAAGDVVSSGTSDKQVAADATPQTREEVRYFNWNANPVKGNFESNKLLYPDLWNATDLLVTTGETGTKEDLILKNALAPTSFEYIVETVGLKLQTTADGGYVFVDEVGNEKFYTPAPNLTDANGQSADGAIHYELGWDTQKPAVKTIETAAQAAVPLAEIKFNDAIGTKFFAEKSSATGTIFGGTWLSGGVSGNALSLNDGQCSAEIARDFKTPQTITLSTWVQPSAYQDGVIAGFGNNTFRQTEKNGFGVTLRIGDKNFVVDSGVSAFELGKWYHLVATFDGTVIRFFIDGVETDSLALKAAGTLAPTEAPILFGGNFAGAVDEFAIFDHAFSAEEIGALHQKYLDQKSVEAKNSANQAEIQVIEESALTEAIQVIEESAIQDADEITVIDPPNSDEATPVVQDGTATDEKAEPAPTETAEPEAVEENSTNKEVVEEKIPDLAVPAEENSETEVPAEEAPAIQTDENLAPATETSLIESLKKFFLPSALAEISQFDETISIDQILNSNEVTPDNTTVDAVAPTIDNSAQVAPDSTTVDAAAPATEDSTAEITPVEAPVVEATSEITAPTDFAQGESTTESSDAATADSLVEATNTQTDSANEETGDAVTPSADEIQVVEERALESEIMVIEESEINKFFAPKTTPEERIKIATDAEITVLTEQQLFAQSNQISEEDERSDGSIVRRYKLRLVIDTAKPQSENTEVRESFEEVISNEIVDEVISAPISDTVIEEVPTAEVEAGTSVEPAMDATTENIESTPEETPTAEVEVGTTESANPEISPEAEVSPTEKTDATTEPAATIDNEIPANDIQVIEDPKSDEPVTVEPAPVQSEVPAAESEAELQTDATNLSADLLQSDVVAAAANVDLNALPKTLTLANGLELTFPIDVDPSTYVTLVNRGARTFAPNFAQGNPNGEYSQTNVAGSINRGVEDTSGERTGAVSSQIIAIDANGAEFLGDAIANSGDWTEAADSLRSNSIASKIKFTTAAATEIFAGLNFSPAGGVLRVTIDKNTDHEISNEIDTFAAAAADSQKVLLATGLRNSTHDVELELTAKTNPRFDSSAAANFRFALAYFEAHASGSEIAGTGIASTADSGSTTTLTAAALTQADDFWQGAALTFTSGPNAGAVVFVTDFSADSHELSFTPAVATAVTTENFQLSPDGILINGRAARGLNFNAKNAEVATFASLDNFPTNPDGTVKRGSLSIWLAPDFAADTDTAKHFIFDNGLARLYFDGADDKFKFEMWDGDDFTTVKVASAEQTFVAHESLHLTASFDAEAGVKLFVNGTKTLQSSKWTAQPLTAADTQITFGKCGTRSAATLTAADTYFAGTLAESQIWNYVLLDSEIFGLFSSTIPSVGQAHTQKIEANATSESSLLFNAPLVNSANDRIGSLAGSAKLDAAKVGSVTNLEFTGDPLGQLSGIVNSQDLAGFWKMDGDFTDSAFSASDATASGGTTFIDGRFAKAAIFDGSDDSLNAGAIAQPVNAVSFWIFADTVSRDIIDFDGGTHALSIVSRQLIATGFDSPTIFIDGTEGTEISRNAWHHIVVTTATPFTASALKIGKKTTFFDGKIDELALFARPLTAAEVAAIYTSANNSPLAVTSAATEIIAGLDTGPNRGIAQITIDGGTPSEITTEVDTFAPTAARDQRFLVATNLIAKEHTIQIENSGVKNLSATAALIVPKFIESNSTSSVTSNALSMNSRLVDHVISPDFAQFPNGLTFPDKGNISEVQNAGTLEFWATGALADGDYFLDTRDDSGDNGARIYMDSASALEFEFQNASAAISITDADFAANYSATAANHILARWWQPTATTFSLSLYLNGQKIAEKISQNFSSSQHSQIILGNDATPDATAAFAGSIFDFAIYANAFTDGGAALGSFAAPDSQVWLAANSRATKTEQILGTKIDTDTTINSTDGAKTTFALERGALKSQVLPAKNYAPTNRDTDFATNTNAALAQEFRLAADGAIPAVGLWLRKVGAPSGDIALSIQTDAAGLPSGTTVANGAAVSFAVDALSTRDYEWVNFNFATPPSLTAGTAYHLVLESAFPSSASNYIVWAADASAPSFVGGTAEIKGTEWAESAADFIFQIYESYPLANSVEAYVDGVAVAVAAAQAGSFARIKAPEGISATATSFRVDSIVAADQIPSSGFLWLGNPSAQFKREKVYFGEYSGGTFSNLKRGIDGTVAGDFGDRTIVEIAGAVTLAQAPARNSDLFIKYNFAGDAVERDSSDAESSIFFLDEANATDQGWAKLGTDSDKTTTVLGQTAFAKLRGTEISAVLDQALDSGGVTQFVLDEGTRAEKSLLVDASKTTEIDKIKSLATGLTDALHTLRIVANVAAGKNSTASARTWISAFLANGHAPLFTPSASSTIAYANPLANLDPETTPDNPIDLEKTPGGNDSYTKLLIQSGETDGATTFADASLSAHTITVNGDTHAATEAQKFGATALRFDGAGDVLVLADADDWNFGDANFTIDGWINLPATTQGASILAHRTVDGFNGFNLIVTAENKLQFIADDDNASAWAINFTSTTALPINEWNHFALVRNGADFALYINGSASGSMTSDAAIYNDAVALTIGGEENNYFFNGYLDELRISKGIARWTKDFTPPTEAYDAVPTEGPAIDQINIDADANYILAKYKDTSATEGLAKITRDDLKRIKIRDAKVSDLPAVVELYNKGLKKGVWCDLPHQTSTWEILKGYQAFVDKYGTENIYIRVLDLDGKMVAVTGGLAYQDKASSLFLFINIDISEKLWSEIMIKISENFLELARSLDLDQVEVKIEKGVWMERFMLDVLKAKRVSGATLEIDRDFNLNRTWTEADYAYDNDAVKIKEAKNAAEEAAKNNAPKSDKETRKLIKQTANTDTYDNGDGTREVLIYSTPENIEIDGEWEKVDDYLAQPETLAQDKAKAGKQYQVKPYDIFVGSDAENKNIIRYVKDGKEFSFSLQDITYQDPNRSITLAEAQAGDIVHSYKSSKFRNIFPGVDLKYHSTKNGVKEELFFNNLAVLGEVSEPDHFKGKVVLRTKISVPEGVIPEMHNDQIFFKQDGQNLFSTSQPFIYDQIQRTYQVGSALKNEQGNYYLEITLDYGWMASDAGAFPLVLDPDLNINQAPDVSLCSDGTCTADRGTGRAYLKFDISTIPSNATIQSASLTLTDNRIDLAVVDLASTVNARRFINQTWNEASAVSVFTGGSYGSVLSTVTTAARTTETWNVLGSASDGLIKEFNDRNTYYSIYLDNGAAFTPTYVNNGATLILGYLVDGKSAFTDTYNSREGTTPPVLHISYVYPLTLTYTAGAGGSITGTSPQTVNYGASGTAVTAVPDTGYGFAAWSDGSTQNPRTDTNVTADISVTANFELTPDIVAIDAGASDADRTSLTSDTWFGAAAIGSDDLASFSWTDPASASDDNFYYTLNATFSDSVMSATTITSTTNFAYTGAVQSYTVPAGVTSITITGRGAGGGHMPGSGDGGAGGLSTGTISVTPGATYYIVVGGAGRDVVSPYNVPGVGGYGGGATGGTSTQYAGGGGGGMTWFSGYNTFAGGTPMLIAGGGGGGGDGGLSSVGGAGGGASGSDGGYISSYGTKGTGGTQTTGGSVGGSSGAGGVGIGYQTYGGGGGGGGLYGGGGGTGSGGGGGGSSYLSSSLTSASTTQGAGAVAAANGSLTITAYTLSTTTPYLDSISLSEGTSYLHVRPQTGSGVWGTERVFTVKYDKTGPTGGSVTHSDSAQTSTTIPVTVSVGTDATSGMSTTDSDYTLNYRSAALSSAGCGTYGDWTDTAADETAAATTYNVTAPMGYCYQFQYTVKDAIGNSTTYTSANTTKVESTSDIVAIDAGASDADRTSLTSDTWFGAAAIGGDDAASFSWTDPASASDDTFYYELNTTADNLGEFFFPLDSLDSATTNWTSTNATNLALSNETTTKDEGIGSAKLVSAVTNGNNESISRSFTTPQNLSALGNIATSAYSSVTGNIIKWHIWEDAMAGVSTWSKSLTTSQNSWQYSFRNVVDASEISTSGNQFRISAKASASTSSTYSGWTICERDAATQNCVAGTWKPIKFSGSQSVTIAAAGTQYSDWMDYDIDEAKTYFITAYANNIIYGSSTPGYYARSGDYSAAQNWGTSGAFYLVAVAMSGVQVRTVPEKIITISSANTWERTTWDISGVTDASIDAVDRMSFRVMNSSAATVYLDDVAIPATSIATPYLDSVTLSEGTSYLHVRPQTGSGVWGTERIFTVKYDKTAPAGGSVTHLNGAQTSTTIPVTVSRGTDAGSGLSTTDSDYTLNYRSAALSSAGCGTYGDWLDTGATETYNATTYSVTAPTGYCYQFQYTVKDVLGNTTTYTSANTTKVASHTLTYTAGAGGSITGTSPQTVADGASGTAVTAVPDTGYYFVGWSDGVTTAARTDTSVVADVSVSATFAPNPDIVAIDAGASDADRTSLTSDTWFSAAAIGSDDLASFSWTDPNSASDDNFYYDSRDSSLISWWQMDGDWTDSAGTNTGTAAGGATFTTSGKIASAGSFDGSGDYISIPDAADFDFGANNFSISWWENRTNNILGASAMAREGVISYPAFLLGYSSGGANLLIYMHSVTNWDVASAKSLGSVTLNTWNYFTVKREGSNFTAYKNGVQTDAWSSALALSASANPLEIANYAAYKNFNGSIDEVKIFNRALTATEIAAEYARGTSTVNAYLDSISLTEGTSYLHVRPQTGSGVWGTERIFTVKYDKTAPTGGSVTHSDSVQTSTTIAVTVSTGTDATSGMSTTDSDYTLRYRSAVLTAGTCAAFSGDWLDSGATETAAATTYSVTAPTGYCYQFQYTVKDVLGNSTTYTSANTTKIASHTLTYTAGAGGSVTGTSPQTVADGASGTAVTAVPDTGYYFVGWSDGVTTAARTDASVVVDISVSATFAPNPDIVAIDAGASSSDRTSLTSDTWFGAAAIGSDDLASFSWTDPASASDDNFYYALNSTVSNALDGFDSLSTGLVSWWKMDNTWADSAGTNTGTASGATFTTSGKIGSAGSFDGLNDYVTVPDSDVLSPSIITLSTWVKINSAGINDIIAGKSGEYWLSYSFAATNCTANRFGFATYNGSAWVCASGTTTPVVGQWYHLLAIHNGTNTYFYIDGVLQATVAQGARPNTTYLFDIGSYSPDASTYAFNGSIDEVKIFNRALTAAEIAAEYARGTSTVNAYLDAVALTEGTSYLHVRPQTGSGVWGTERVFTVKYDKTAPTGGSVTHSDSAQTSTTIPVTVSVGTDAGSGLGTTDSDYTLRYRSAVLTAGTCAAFAGDWLDTGATETYNATTYNVTAPAGYCYQFQYTVKDVTGNSTTYTSANTTKVSSHTLTYTAGAGGSITGTSPQTVADGASGTAVTAVASTGYYFVGWSDGVTTAARTDASVTADVSVSAVFRSSASARRLPLAYTVHTYGTLAAGRTFQSLAAWEDLTDVNLSSVTTTDQASSGNTLYIASTTLFDNAVLNESTVSVAGQILTITGVTPGVSLTVSDISGTIPSGTALKTGFVLTAYDDAAPYNDSIAMAGATTTSSFYRVVRAADGQRGTPTSGVRFEVSSSTAAVFIISLSENYASAQDIAVKAVTTFANSYAFGIYTVNGFSYQSIIGCTAYDCHSNGTGIYTGLGAYSNGAKIINSFVTGCSGGANTQSGGIVLYSSGTTGSNTTYVYNCTSKNNGIGITVRSQHAGYTTTANITNSIVQDNTSYNIYDSGGLGTEIINQTTNATSGVTFAADGYHLASTDTVAKDHGTNLSADATFAFGEDLDKETRTGTWDIGADEYVVSEINLDTLHIVEGNNQLGGIDEALPTELKVRVGDGLESGETFAGADETEVTFTLYSVPESPTAAGQLLTNGSFGTTFGGTEIVKTVTTDADGYASVSLTLGDRAGDYTVIANFDGCTTALADRTFTVTEREVFRFTLTPANLDLTLDPSVSAGADDSTVIEITTNAASFAIGATPHSWLTLGTDTIANWNGTTGFGWDNNNSGTSGGAATATAFTDLVTPTPVFTCVGTACQGTQNFTLDLHSAVDYLTGAGNYESNLELSGVSVEF
ncbi:MAG: LamG-like jellyroll fold domain-containing protein [Patescibacteria group bacterium]